MSIFVDIEKKLGSFTLHTKFSAENETLALLGESGCGKSITLLCIAGVIKPDRGKIVVDDIVFFDSQQNINLTPQERKTGILFQNYALFPNMTVYENIMLGTKRENNKSIRKQVVDDIIQKFHIENISTNYPHQISGGQRQRVALARILVSKPSILLLDEPFSALDSHLKFKLEREMITTINEFSKTVILVSHDRDEVYRLSDSIAIMKDGSIEQIGKKEDVFKNPITKNGAILTGCKNISDIIIISENKIFAEQWGIDLEVEPERFNSNIKSVGIRLHDIKLFYDRLSGYNTSNNFDKLDNISKSEDVAGKNIILDNHIYKNAHHEPNVFRCNICEKIENTFSYTLMLNILGASMKTPIGIIIDKNKYQAIVDHNNNGKNSIYDINLQIVIPKDSIICMYT